MLSSRSACLNWSLSLEKLFATIISSTSTERVRTYQCTKNCAKLNSKILCSTSNSRQIFSSTCLITTQSNKFSRTATPKFTLYNTTKRVPTSMCASMTLSTKLPLSCSTTKWECLNPSMTSTFLTLCSKTETAS
jgi:hypothetical protein